LRLKTVYLGSINPFNYLKDYQKHENSNVMEDLAYYQKWNGLITMERTVHKNDERIQQVNEYRLKMHFKIKKLGYAIG
jgi:hypothetical protein